MNRILTLSFVAQVHHGIDRICSNGGRAEQSTKVIEIEFVDAHGPLSWSHISLRVDVPRFELGNRIAERIRCFILGFQVAERLAAWNNTRYGGGL
jgi:hypothetical protein